MQKDYEQVIAAAADRLGLAPATAREALHVLWESAFAEGRLAALDELQDRFCVCMK
jgi:hypothetical protein